MYMMVEDADTKGTFSLLFVSPIACKNKLEPCNLKAALSPGVS